MAKIIRIIQKEEEKADNEFTIRKKQKIYSLYDKRLEERKVLEELEKERKAKTIDDDEPDELGEGDNLNLK
jgi:hypothetical protein